MAAIPIKRPPNSHALHRPGSVAELGRESEVLDTIQLNSPAHSVMLDITDLIADKVREGGIHSGMCLVFVPHTTAGITINEGADPAVQEDLFSSLERLVPWKGLYRHLEGNSAAHVKASLMGSSVQVIIDNGRLVLGTWQRIFLCEFDGPRTRKIRIKILRE